jgi:nucleotide-binding universal stress UspA family protein
MWKRLLVPHDFSDGASSALALAAQIAGHFAAEVVLVHVSALPPNVARDALVMPDFAHAPVRVAELAAEGAVRELDRIAAPLVRAGLTARTLAAATEANDVADTILEVAQRESVDAIVMGTHGRTGLLHLLLGSVAERVVRRAPVPVVIVRSKSAEATLTREESQVEDEVVG